MNESQARLPRIVVRGTRDGLVIVLPERGTTREIVQALAQRIAGAEGFFRGAEVVLDYGTRDGDRRGSGHAAPGARGARHHACAPRPRPGSIAAPPCAALGFSPLSAMPQPPVRGDEPASCADDAARRTADALCAPHLPLRDVAPSSRPSHRARRCQSGRGVDGGGRHRRLRLGSWGCSCRGDGRYGAAIIAALVLTPTQLRIGDVYGRPTDAHRRRPERGGRRRAVHRAPGRRRTGDRTVVWRARRTAGTVGK